MKKYKDTIAGEDEVINRAVENLKEENEIYLTKEEMKEVYDITVKYLREKLVEGKWATVKLPYLGRAYYTQPSVNRKKFQFHNRYKKEGSEIYRERRDNFARLYDEIEEHYQNNQPKKNVRKDHKWYHVIVPFIKSAKYRGFSIEDIEEIQNKIE